MTNASYFNDYADSDSPFVIAYNDARKFSGDGLAVYDISALDEFESCALSLLNRPAYENDAELIEFRNALHNEIERRYFDAPDDAAHHNH